MCGLFDECVGDGFGCMVEYCVGVVEVEIDVVMIVDVGKCCVVGFFYVE